LTIQVGYDDRRAVAKVSKSRVWDKVLEASALIFVDTKIFYPARDAMLARLLTVALCPCLSVCLSVTSRCSIKSDERINLVFGMGASFDQSYTAF